MKQTHCERILDYMERFGSITSWEAMFDLGIGRLASRICDLRKDGYPIKSERATGVNRLGEKIHFARYYMDK